MFAKIFSFFFFSINSHFHSSKGELLVYGVLVWRPQQCSGSSYGKITVITELSSAVCLLYPARLNWPNMLMRINNPLSLLISVRPSIV
jgi:hypothetical protein